ncbi:patatin-like phospholipase [Xylariales sp. AK1849]|nr:patatin-like phospholipase [Xylariales sp. AK1849]
MAQLVLPNLRITPVPSNHNSAKSPASKKGTRPIQNVAIEPLSRAIKGAGNLVLRLRDGLTTSEREARRALEERKQILSARLQNAETYKQWDKAAHELDALEGNDEWKEDTLTGDYCPGLIEERLTALDEARTNCDLRAMMHLIRTSLTRDLGGMGNIDLYRHSYCGTKKLIERYVDSAIQTITTLVEQSSRSVPEGLESKDLLDAVLFARQSFGRSALLLSGGGTFGMSHIGVLKAMLEVRLLPRIISGASAGSIVCSVVCTRTDDEIPQLINDFPHGDLSVFEEQGNEDSLVGHLRRLLTQGNWSDIKHLTRVMRDLLGDLTFQEAYNRTRRICNICVSSASIYELPRLLNYVTAPNVMIWSAVAASCSVPLVFSAAPLLVKNPLTGEHSPWNPTPQMWIDGSVDNDLPMTRLAEMFNVNHFIVSQVNPHVVPFLARDDAPYPITASHNQLATEQSDWMYTLTQLAKDEALHRMQVLAEIGIFPNLVTKLRSILSQKYSGDINILPAIGILDLPKILKNPTTDFMYRSCLLGERATWPKLSRIRDRCAIEVALDRAVHSLRARVVFSKSQVDLRRSITDPLGGSHEPLNTISPPSASMSSKERLKRRRRSSGSNLQLVLAHRRHLDEAYKVTDDDTDDEERLEMTYRRPHGKPKLRLKRLPNNLSLQRGPSTTPHLSSFNEPDAFNFADPLASKTLTLDETPIKHILPVGNRSTLDAIDVEDSPDFEASDEGSMSSPAHRALHLNEIETSDPHSSDADIDSRSDDSATDIVGEASKLGPHAVEDEWLHPRDEPSRQPMLEEDTSSPVRRERDSRYSISDFVDPGAGIWD